MQICNTCIENINHFLKWIKHMLRKIDPLISCSSLRSIIFYVNDCNYKELNSYHKRKIHPCYISQKIVDNFFFFWEKKYYYKYIKLLQMQEQNILLLLFFSLNCLRAISCAIFVSYWRIVWKYDNLNWITFCIKYILIGKFVQSPLNNDKF